MKVELKAIGDHIIIRPTKIEKERITKAGVIVPLSVTKSEKPNPTATIIAIGKDAEGTLKIGDTVVYPEHSVRLFDYEGENYLIINEPNILATIEY